MINLNRFMTKGTENASHSALWTPEEKSHDVTTLNEMRFQIQDSFSRFVWKT